MKKHKSAGVVIKNVPQRTCIACRKGAVKRELVRLVNVPGTGVEVDATGKKSGRGAYLCPDRACWDIALKSGRLTQALRTEINPENRQKLTNYAGNFENNRP
jgi:uncharacterized protein